VLQHEIDHLNGVLIVDRISSLKRTLIKKEISHKRKVANGELVFFGTAAIGLPILKELNKNFNLKLIVTQPDTRGGRNRQLFVPRSSSSPLRTAALHAASDLQEPELELAIRRIDPFIAVVVAYGQFIPRAIHSLPASRRSMYIFRCCRPFAGRSGAARH